MKTSVNIDLVVVATDEAKICLTCKKKKCTGYCARLKEEKQKLNNKKGVN